MEPKQINLSEILRDIEFGPIRAKLDAIGRICFVTDIALSDVQATLERVLCQALDGSPLKFFAAANLARFGDSRDIVVDALIPYLGASAFERGDDLVYFPWLGDRSSHFPQGIQHMGFLCQSSTQLATLEALSHIRANDRAGDTLSQFLEALTEIPWRTFTIYAIGANGNPATRSTLEYYADKYSSSFEGEAARKALEHFGSASLFELAQAHRDKTKPKSKVGSVGSIYIYKGGQQYGPYPISDVKAWLTSGQLQANDLACYEGASEWIVLSSVPGISRD